jgi:RNA polymerase sigma-70 factor (ECF subfamily)
MKNQLEHEADIISRALNGEESACQTILNSYKGRIFSYVYRTIRNYHDAEDITLDAFVRCFKSLKSYDPKKLFSTWLYTIAHNLTIDFLRKNKQNYENIDERPIEDIEIADEKSSRPALDYEKQQKLTKVDQALAQLAPIDREIVVLFHREEKSYQEISAILKIPETTIKTRLHRARLRLKELVKQ